MLNHTSKKSVYLLLICLSLSACSIGQKRISRELNEKPKVEKLSEPINLKVNVKEGDEFIYKYNVVSLTRTYEKSQILRKREESLDFTVKKSIQSNDGTKVRALIQTIEKDGVIDLHDVVMPRVGEQLLQITDLKSKVIKAGDYSKTSAFYLSPVSLPENEVRIGDTWFLQERWINEKSEMPMMVELVSILKNTYRHNDRIFAEIETSGQVVIPEEVMMGLGFESEIVGRILMDLETAEVVWSEIRNNEKLYYPDAVIRVNTCMEMKMMSPLKLKWPWALEPKCDPKKDFVYAIPGN